METKKKTKEKEEGTKKIKNREQYKEEDVSHTER